jgi:hypothetical protein
MRMSRNVLSLMMDERKIVKEEPTVVSKSCEDCSLSKFVNVSKLGLHLRLIPK